MSKITNKFSPEVLERKIRMALAHGAEHPSRQPARHSRKMAWSRLDRQLEAPALNRLYLFRHLSRLRLSLCRLVGEPAGTCKLCPGCPVIDTSTTQASDD